MEPLDRASIQLPAFGLTALEILETAGLEAWAVGGCVRDGLRRLQPHDIDIACIAPWQQTAQVLRNAGVTVHETGTQHGTVTAMVEGQPIEITAFRKDGTYSDGRHPDSVQAASSIEEDLARRDFTINAMAFSPTRGLRDPFGGAADLQAGIIRAVGDPATRFQEDALRILRAWRFRAQTGFIIDDDTLMAIHANRERLGLVSAERLEAEFRKLLCGPWAAQVIMEGINEIGVFIPEALPMDGLEQRTKYHVYNVLEHTAWAVDAIPTIPYLRYAAFFHDIGKPECATIDANGTGHFYGHPVASARICDQVMRRLHFGNDERERIYLLVRYHDYEFPCTAKGVKRMLRKLGGSQQAALDLLEVKRADSLAHAPAYRERALAIPAYREVLRQVIDEGQAFTLAALDINGNDLMAAGIPQGPRIGELLGKALDAVVDERLENEHDALLAFCLEAFRA